MLPRPPPFSALYASSPSNAMVTGDMPPRAGACWPRGPFCMPLRMSIKPIVLSWYTKPTTMVRADPIRRALLRLPAELHLAFALGAVEHRQLLEIAVPIRDRDVLRAVARGFLIFIEAVDGFIRAAAFVVPAGDLAARARQRFRPLDLVPVQWVFVSRAEIVFAAHRRFQQRGVGRNHFAFDDGRFGCSCHHCCCFHCWGRRHGNEWCFKVVPRRTTEPAPRCWPKANARTFRPAHQLRFSSEVSRPSDSPRRSCRDWSPVRIQPADLH